MRRAVRTHRSEERAAALHSPHSEPAAVPHVRRERERRAVWEWPPRRVGEPRRKHSGCCKSDCVRATAAGDVGEGEITYHSSKQQGRGRAQKPSRSWAGSHSPNLQHRSCLRMEGIPRSALVTLLKLIEGGWRLRENLVQYSHEHPTPTRSRGDES